MALSRQRIHKGAETPYPWEREAVDFVIGELPDVDPYNVWPLVEFVVPTTGQLYEVDLLVLSRHSLYLVEIKSHRGVLTGDSRDWAFTHEGRRSHIENPLYATNRKARVLGNMLKRELPFEHQIWVEALVFLSAPGLEVRLDESGRTRVTDRNTIRRAVTHAEYPGSGNPRARVVNRPTMRKVVQALHKLGVRPSQTKRLVGEYQLGELLDEGSGYQEHVGEHRSVSGLKARVRSYLVPRATSDERKRQLERAAQREARILTDIGSHPLILRCTDYRAEGPIGPALVFEQFEGGESLELFMRRKTEMSFDDRLEILEKVAEALHYCHRRNVLHRNLSPSSILVRRRPEGPLEVRLHSFQLALQLDESLGTRHISALSDARDLVYQSPEVLEDPTKATNASDVFSLGAVAYFVLSGHSPAENIVEREEKILEHDGLRLTAVRDDVSPGVDEVVAMATNFYAANRPDNPMEWLALLLEEATRPEPVEAEPEIDPHEAKPGAELTGGFQVKRDLGSGSTARVLQVVHEGKNLALKVPHDEGCSERLRAECELLSQLPKHTHIVGCHGTRRLGERDCLLLDFAGSDNPKDPQTLADLLRRDGTVGLDYARRFGDDLLSALQHLEENGVQHRDVKPANIGFTPSGKKARHLVLFDFSFAADDVGGVTGGTPHYRDPHLRLRGAWDSTADRYSAAVVLHEVLTGLRPSMPEEAGTAAQTGHLPMARIEAERLDAAIRDRLVAFFERALHPDAEQRHPSAEEMKAAWLSTFVEPAARAAQEAAPTQETPASAEATSIDELLAGATLQTPVEVLPLSVRARNALERAGVATAGELIALPRNQLSAVRGVGQTVAKEIQDLAEALRRRFTEIAGDAPEVFAPSYAGLKVGLRPDTDLGLDADTNRRLVDAGITNTVDLAGSSQARVVRLLGTKEASRLRSALLASTETAPAGTVTSWAAELLPLRKGKPLSWQQHSRVLLGMNDLPGSVGPRADLFAGRDVPTVAKAFGISRAAVYIGLQKAREHWGECASLEPLVEAAQNVVDGLGGACSLEEAARELVLGHDGGPEAHASHLRGAGALLRLVTELRSESSPATPLRLARIAGRLWLGASRQHIDLVRQLGRAADALAAEDPLPSIPRVRATLERIVEDTPLASLSPERLVTIAALASSQAAASSRLEIYPRGMSAERAVDLASQVLSVTELAPEEVRKRLASRYPEADIPPQRPALDKVLAHTGLVFDQDTGRYRREDQALPTTTGPGIVSSRLATALPHQAPKLTPGALEARSFDETLRTSVERGRFRVLQVGAREAEGAANLLGNVLGVVPTSLDKLLWTYLEAERERLEVDAEAVIEADRAGPLGPSWQLLRELVRSAAGKMVAEVLSSRERPQILIHPGTLARYGLDLELQELVERAEHEDGAAILLLVPSYDDGSHPSINNALPVPAPLPGQRLRVPRSWLTNEHRAAAEER